MPFPCKGRPFAYSAHTLRCLYLPPKLTILDFAMMTRVHRHTPNKENPICWNREVLQNLSYFRPPHSFFLSLLGIILRFNNYHSFFIKLCIRYAKICSASHKRNLFQDDFNWNWVQILFVS